MIDLKFLDMTKINFAFTDDEKLLDLSEIAIGLPKEEFKKIIEYNQRNLRSLWLARALRAKSEAGQFLWFMSVDVSQGNKEAEFFHESLYKKWCWVERKCREKAKEFE